jgi:hypothetical protein
MYPAGRALLNGPLKMLILSHALNAVVKFNEAIPFTEGWSAASVLITSEFGNEMFASKSPDLFNMITEEGLQSRIPQHLQLHEPYTDSVSEWLRLPLHVRTHAELKARYVLSNLKIILLNTQWTKAGERPQPIQDQLKEIESAEKSEKSYDAALARVVSIGKFNAANLGLFATDNLKAHHQKFVETRNIYALR